MPGVADQLVNRMRAAGVRALFGLPGGGGNLDLIDAARRAGLPFVLTTTETGSALAALAQSELTGTPGACLTTIGPGAASVVNGIACAYLDRAPVLVMTDSYAAAAGSFAHQRLDVRSLLAPVTKWSGSLAPAQAFQAIDDCFLHLDALPPGPVHLDCPGDFENAVPGAPHSGSALGGGAGTDRSTFDLLLKQSRRPLLIVGLGAREEADAAAIQSLCDDIGLPALVTYKAKGVVPDSHPWFAGVFTHASIERAIVDRSDLLIGIGFDPVEILPRPWKYSQPIVSVARWHMAADHVPFQAQRVGPVAGALDEIRSQLGTTTWDVADVARIRSDAMRAVDPPGAGMTSQDVVRTLARGIGTARVTVDAGAHMFAATTLWPVEEPNGLLISNGLSTMGFALPAAIGAATADSRRVVALTGDGGLLICIGELQTAVRERLKVMTVVFNDASLSLIEIKQQQRRLTPQGVDIGDVQWPRIAEGFGVPAWTASSVRELEAAVAHAAQVNGPSLIEARIDRSNYPATLEAIRGTT